MSVYRLGPTSATAVTLLPDYDFNRPLKQLKSESRTRQGKLYVHRWANYQTFKFSIDYVPSSVAAVVNSWWATNTLLRFFIDSGTASEVHSVQITNDNEPLAKFSKPYENLYEGIIELEEY